MVHQMNSAAPSAASEKPKRQAAYAAPMPASSLDQRILQR